MKLIHSFSLLASCCVAVAALAESAGTDLFNGKDLSGWTQRGGKAKYTIEGEAIVGTCVLNTPNSFLCTDKTYGDFIFEYDVGADDGNAAILHLLHDGHAGVLGDGSLDVHLHPLRV